VSRSVPLRRSLLVRLLATSVLIAVCSIAATAWLAVQTTTRAIQQAQGQALADDAKIYDGLVGYAATHPSWDGVGPTLAELGAGTGRRITLTTTERTPIARSSVTSEPLSQKESAVVDPLHTDPALKPEAAVRIDPRAVGPYRLSAAEREKQQTKAAYQLECMAKAGAAILSPTSATQDLAGYISIDPSVYQGDARKGKILGFCDGPGLAVPDPVEARALTALTGAVDRCLATRKHDPVKLVVRYDRPYLPTQRFSSDVTVQNCLNAARRNQLRHYVAPPALLFVQSPGGVAQTRFNLSGPNLARIVGVAALVLLIAVAVTVLVGARLVRPLRALTAAAQDPAEQHARMPVTGKDEIGLLAVALNSLTERRERAEEQRTAMVSDVAHELRTPLTNIRSWLEAIEDGLATPASDPALTGALLREALQLQAIIDDLQDLAVADATGLRLSPEVVPVGELLEQVIRAHGGSAEAGGVELAADATDRLEVTADPMRLRQALGNLVANAIRYTPAGGDVSLVARREGAEVVISVVDSGRGIPAADLPQVFDRFWRADRSRSRETGGSGLGLAIVRQIAEAHGGSVGATSVEGRGSVFVLRLPGPTQPD
jgi:two-component system sensor histidine kinase BaeS